MLTMNARTRSSQICIGVLLCGLPALGVAKDPRAPSTEERTLESPSRQPLGAPQVLEIPPVRDTAPPATAVLPSESLPQHDAAGAVVDPEGRRVLDERGGSTARRTYFGALYATAETGEGGVTVLDVIPGSPAARAGFEGVNAQRSTRGQLADALIVGAAPLAGPFAPLIILPYAIYRSRQAPGDLIVAVGEQQVRDAVEFSQALRNHQPGDTVTFSVLRQGKSLQIPVQLEEEPL